MTTFLVSMTLILNLILQSVILPGVKILGTTPNTALAIVVVIALSKGRIYGGIVGLISGLVLDVMFSMTIGIGAFILFFTGYLTGFASDSFAKENAVNPVLFTVVGTVFYNALFAMFMFFTSRNITLESAVRSIFSFELILNGIAAILIYFLFRKIFSRPQIRFNRR